MHTVSASPGNVYLQLCFKLEYSVLVLPLATMIQFLSVHCLKAQSSFLPTFSRIYRVSKVVNYITVELSMRMPLGFLYLVWLARYGYGIIKETVFVYALFCIVCMTCDIIYTQWVFRRILLSGDLETNPGPDTLDFCCWNVNSITAHEFLRVSLIEAYNSVYNYDLIGIVETHLDSMIDEGRLALDGYTFVKSDHPQNVKRGGVGLYIEDSLASRDRSDLVTFRNVLCVKFKIIGKSISLL